MIGEAVFGRLVGQPLNAELLVDGDQKVDFIVSGVRFDVKTTAYFDEPWLRVTPEDLEKSDAFALVAVDENLRRARYCGYATAETVRRARTRKMSKAMPESHQLGESDLVADLPT
jgi:hypothetical protein